MKLYLRSYITVFVAIVSMVGSSNAQQLVVQPYLQDASPDEIYVMWETDTAGSSEVEWGPDTTLANLATGNAQTGFGNSQIHTVQLTGLQAATRYHYRVKTNSTTSAIYDFITPPLASSEASFNLVAMSDMQRNGNWPNKFSEICHDGVIDHTTDRFTGDLPTDLGFVMIPGDLVDNGFNYGEWANTFFAPSHSLFAHVPVYPVLGNHEANTPFFFQYFKLPENGTSGFEEHWWHKDYSNVRIIGLDSNVGFTIQQQLDWLEALLLATCADTTIDFVFAQLHHPHLSELWTPGELDYTGDVIELLEDFTTNCGKPSIHFFGHTHGYSRGHSQDHTHLWVNVATAGGAREKWGEWPQEDYDEFTVSQDEWGFVLVEVEAGADPEFRLTRVTRGDDVNNLDNEVTDSIVIRKNNQQPQQPTGLFPAENQTVSPDCIMLLGDAFSDPDNDEHGASQWQISSSCSDFSSPVFESWRQFQNWYFEVDRQAGDVLTDEEVQIGRASCRERV